MKTLYEPDTVSSIIDRISRLHSGSERKWGKMDTAQMLALCTAALEVAAAKRFPPRWFIGYVLGPLLKPALVNHKPFLKNPPVGPNSTLTGKRDFIRERTRLVGIISQFYAGGHEKCTTHPHWFFGRLTPQEWATGMYKHLDHYLRQFGV